MSKMLRLWSTWKGPAATAFAVISAIAVGSLFIASKLATLEEIEAKLSTSDNHLAKIADQMGQLKAQVNTLELRLSESSSRGPLDDKLHQQQEEALRRIVDDVSEMRIAVARMDAILEIIKPLVTEGLAFGRISLDDVQKIYTPAEIAEFLKDAERLFGPEGGGGGGGGSDFRVARGTFTSTGECLGVARNCVFMSFKFKDEDSVDRVARIELLYNLKESDLATILPSHDLEEREELHEVLRTAENYPGRLCRWFGERLRTAMASNKAA